MVKANEVIDMEIKPLVSIVLPTYNGKKYIRESIDSILEQTFHDWELIIVEDCSKDKTPQIVDEYAMMDSRINVIHNTSNQKLPESLNIGFRKAKGKYLTWTSDDNIFLPEALEVMVEALEQAIDSPMVCADMQYIDECGNITGEPDIPFTPDSIWLQDYVGACFMYRRQVLDRVGEYDTDKFLVEDYDYWLRISDEMGDIRRIPQVLYKYRRHSGSLTETRRRDVSYQRARLRIKYQDKIKQYYVNSPEILCEIYYDFIMSGHKDNEFTAWIEADVPELKYEQKSFSECKKYAVFGAGEIGDRVWNLLDGNVICYIDNDTSKQGKKKHGVEICSLTVFQHRYPDTEIIIAITYSHIYEIIKQLLEAGKKSFGVYQTLAIYCKAQNFV